MSRDSRKTRKLVGYLVFLWLFCGWLAWGGMYAREMHLGDAYVYQREDLAFCMVWGEVGGPLSLTITMVATGFFEYGFQWWGEPKKERVS